MPFKIPLLAAAMVMLAATAAAAPSESPKSKGASVKLPMLFYLAKGEADACGDGCSEWIAAEGGVDSGAGQRLRTFLNRLGKRKLPIYFHSPGGDGTAATEMGRLLREREMTAGVSMTIPAGCEGASEQDCRALKQSGQVLPSTLHNEAGCSSACVFALIGAKVRHVPPGARLGVHAARLEIVRSDGRKVDYSDKRTISYQRTRLVEVNAQRRRYVQEMKIDVRLFDLAASVPHESIHYLSRDEIAGFGIDTREFQEARWRLVPQQAWVMKYFVDAKGQDRKELGTSVIRLECGGMYTNISYLRKRASYETGAEIRTIGLVSGDRRVPLDMSGARRKLDQTQFDASYDLWATYTSHSFFEAAATAESIEIVETDAGKPTPRVTTLSTAGLSQAITVLRRRCSGATDAGHGFRMAG